MSCKNAMQDGRAFTDYTPNCSMNEFYQHMNKVNNSTEYRLFLQRHARALINDKRSRSERQNVTGCKCMYQHPPHDKEWNPKPYDTNDTSYLMKYHIGQVTPFAHGQNRWASH